MQYNLELNEEQASTLQAALEFFASMRLMMAFEVSRNEQTDREATGVALIQNPEYERLEKQCNELLRERTILQLKIMNLEKNTVYQEKEADDEQ